MPFILSLLLTCGASFANEVDVLREPLALTLTPRTSNALNRAGLVTWGDFRDRYLEIGRSTFALIRGLGPAGAREVRSAPQFAVIFIGTPLDPRSHRLTSLVLSKRTLNALELHGITSLVELLRFVRTEGRAGLLEIPDVSKGGRDEILELLAEFDVGCEAPIVNAAPWWEL